MATEYKATYKTSAGRRLLACEYWFDLVCLPPQSAPLKFLPRISQYFTCYRMSQPTPLILTILGRMSVTDCAWNEWHFSIG